MAPALGPLPEFEQNEGEAQMSKNRRQFLQLASGVAAVAAGLSISAGAATTAISDVEAEQRALLSHLASLGHREQPGLDLITGHPFNGGLRYDETVAKAAPGKTMCRQFCGRVEDIAKKGMPGVLAGFTIVGFRDDAPAFDGELLVMTLDYLVRRAGLPSSRLVLVSTEWIAAYRSHHERFGISVEQVVQRDSANAMAVGDGSGFFAPKGHPLAPKIPTVSIHYVIDGGPSAGRRYPVTGAIELGEVSLRAGPRRDVVAEVGGLGLERLLMAHGKPAPSFAQSRRRLMAAMAMEAKRRGVPLPEAYRAFKKA